MGTGGERSRYQFTKWGYADTKFNIYDADSPTRIIDFDVGNITAGNTRTIIMADQDIDLDLLTATAGTVSASKAVIVDASKDITGYRNMGMTGTLACGAVTATASASPQIILVDTGDSSQLTLKKLNAGGAEINTSDASAISFLQSIGVTGNITGTGDLTRTGDTTLTGDITNTGGFSFVTQTYGANSIDMIYSATNHVLLSQYHKDSAGGPLFKYKRGRGSLASPNVCSASDYIARFAFSAWTTGTTYKDAAAIKVYAVSTHSSTNAEGRMEFYTCPNASVTAALAMTIESDGTLNLEANDLTTTGNVDCGASCEADDYSVGGTSGASFGPAAPSSITVVNGIVTAIS